MGAVGNHYYNAQDESFKKTLIVEDIYPNGYEAFADVVEQLPTFIVEVCNANRLHSSDRTSEEFETQLAQHAAWFEASRWSSPKGSLQSRVSSE